MCLLIVFSRVVPEAPLVVAANRDERYARPARSMAVLRSARPRILGGRDELAGGTWLAVNQHGVVAELTNRPSPAGRDPSKQSRGKLPLALARHRDAARAVAAVAPRLNPEDYNPCWLLVGDRRSLFYLDLSTPAGPQVTELGAGVHVLENCPLGVPSAKVDHVAELLRGAEELRGAELSTLLQFVLADHTVVTHGPGAAASPEETADWRPSAVSACCVHTPDYGTRSATLVSVPRDPDAAPAIAVADGPPCAAPFVDSSSLWAL